MTKGELAKTETAAISGFWRRLAAFAIDGILLGVAGWVLGFAFYDSLAATGAWGRAIGFCIALVYFSVMNSRLCGGQTLGKMVMGIRVVGRDGAPLAFPVSLGRSAIFCAPYFLNNAPLPAELLMSWLASVLTLLIFGVGGSIIYLLIFNRRTRQGLHDLIVGSYVVRTNVAGAPGVAMPVWRVHVAIAGAMMVVAALVPMFTGQLARIEPFVSLLAVQRTLSSEPGIRYATVQVSNSVLVNGDGSKTTTGFTARVVMASDAIDREVLANRIAQIALDGYPPAGGKAFLAISLSYGYDIGIASAWRSREFAFSPAQWRQRISGKSI
jgi:uncharacterized RDD family membrane protein YckC